MRLKTNPRQHRWVKRLGGVLPLILYLIVGVAGGDGLYAQAAEDSFAACQERFRAAPEDYESSYCFYEAAREGRRWQEAEARLERLLAEDPENHWPRVSLGNVHWRLDPSRAEATYRAAAEGFKEQGRAAAEVLARTNLHFFLLRYGAWERAEAELERVVEVAAEADDPIVTARALVLEADHLRLQGRDLETAYRLLRQAEPLLFPDGPVRLRRSCLISLGSSCYRLSRYGEARRYYQRLEELARETGDHNSRALFKYNQANTLLAEMFELPAAGSREKLVSMYREALAVAEAAAHRSAAVQSHRSLGDLLSPFEESRDQARGHIDSCIALAREMGHRRRQAACLRTLGGHLARWGEPRSAVEMLDESLALAKEAGDVRGVTRVWETRMRASWRQGPRSQALAETRLALDAVEHLRDRQPEASGRAGLFAAWADLYYWPAGRLLGGASEKPRKTGSSNLPRGDVEMAFNLAERLRARVLLEILANSRSRGPRGDDEALQAVLKDLVETQRRLLETDLSDVERRRTLRELENIEMREMQAQQRPPMSTSASGDDQEFAALSDVESALAEDEAVLSFQIALWQDVFGDFGGGSWLLATTRRGTRVYRLPDRRVLRPAVRLFRGLFDARDNSEAMAATRLYEQLLADAVADLPPEIRRLVIVPDGDLHLLPFAALRDPASGEPLARRFQLSRVPSATLWLRWRRDSRDDADTPGVTRPDISALALADPLPPAGIESLEARRSAIGALASSDRPPAADRDWALASGDRLGALSHARDEGRAVIRHVGAKSRLLLGADASESFLKSASFDAFGILHFAAHAVIDTERPQRSAVLLGAGAPDEDGLLQPRDIAGLDLRGKVVVLSACQSASGAVLQGEGVLSLARAFFEAGASAVVGSLWRLRDDEAAAFFDRFYRHLADGESVAGALAAAREDRIRAGAPAAAWAGLVVIGDGGVVPVPGGRPSKLPRGLVLAVAVGLLMLVAARSGRRLLVRA